MDPTSLPDVVPAWYYLHPMKELKNPALLAGRKCRAETDHFDAKFVLVDIIGLSPDNDTNEIAIVLDSLTLVYTRDELSWCNSPIGHIIIVAEGLMLTVYRPPSV